MSRKTNSVNGQTRMAVKRFTLLSFSVLLVFSLFASQLGQVLLSTPKVSAATCGPTTNFITTWKTDYSGTSNSSSITIPGEPSETYNYQADWNNDGTMDETITSASHTHDFGTPGTYTIQVCGTFPRISFNNNGDKLKITRINQWGNNAWVSMENAFKGASNLDVTATDTPNLSLASTTASMFSGASSLVGNASFNNWDTSGITSLHAMFRGATSFNQPVGNWDVGSVTEMSELFSGASVFNQDISSWDVSSVINMSFMFSGANYTTGSGNAYITNYPMAFNQDLSTWNTGNVAYMHFMFMADGDSYLRPLLSGSYTVIALNAKQPHAFSQSLGDWNVSNVDLMLYMLSGSSMSAANYDATLNGWSGQALQNNVSLGAHGLRYCESGMDRSSILSTYSWTVADEGVGCLDLAPDSGLAGIDVAVDGALVNPDSSERTVRLLRDGLPLSEAKILFENAVDWSAVTGAVDATSYKSVVANLAGADSTLGSHTLYIPKAAFHNAVVICPNALTLPQVVESCANRQVLTASSANVVIVVIDDKTYWKVGGLTGTGGVSIVSAPGAPNAGVGRDPLSKAIPIFMVIVLMNAGAWAIKAMHRLRR